MKVNHGVGCASMTKVKIVTDSTVDMTEEEFNTYHITMVPLSISVNGQTYLEQIELTSDEFLEQMRRSEELPKSSQPAVGTFAEVYDQLGADGSEVISIHMTGGMSGTVQSAESAASMTDTNVTVVDSAYISKALSFQVIEAAKMAQAGKSVSEIIERLDAIQKNTRLIIVIHRLDNLIKGGRIGKLAGWFGSLLNIKPIAVLADGVLQPVAKVRTQSQIIKFILKQMEQDLAGKKLIEASMVHANNLELSEKISQAVIEMMDIQTMKIEDTTPVITTHAGEGALAIMYYWE